MKQFGGEQSSCKNKRCYENKKRARRVATLMRKKLGDKGLREYRCRFCHGWHVGHNVPASIRTNALKRT